MQSAQQSMAAQQQATQAQAQAQAQAPPPDVLYNNALRDYNGGKNDLAAQEFADYSSSIPTPIWREIRTSIWLSFSSARATIKQAVQTTTRCCRISPAETKPLRRS